MFLPSEVADFFDPIEDLTEVAGFFLAHRFNTVGVWGDVYRP